MSAVYAHDIHSAIQEIVNKVRVVPSLARHGNHDAHMAIRWGLAERSDSMFLKQSRTFVKLSESFLDRSTGPHFARKFVEQSQQSVERGYHMGLQTAERTEREPPKIFLQFPEVVPAQAHIMHKISRALQVSRTNVIEFLAKMLLCLQDLKPNRLESSDNGLDLDGEVFVHLTGVTEIRSGEHRLAEGPESGLSCGLFDFIQVGFRQGDLRGLQVFFEMSYRRGARDRQHDGATV